MSDYIFDKIKTSLLAHDPVQWCEKYLTLDGKPFRLMDSGYKPLVDIFRYIGVKALDRDAKPVVWVKARQVAGTTTASALEMYFMGSGLFGNANNPPMRIIHNWPTLDRAAAYSKTKLASMIDSSVLVDNTNGKKGQKPYMKSLIDNSSQSNDNMGFKQFVGGNHLWIESVGLEGNRLRGKQLCLDTELPTPNGFIKLADIQEGQDLFDESGNICQVTKVHPINETPEAYRIIFDDDTIVDACADHLWLTYTKSNRISASKAKKPSQPTIKTTKDIVNTIKIWGESNHSIPTTQPINYSHKDLLIDPYLLGIWLGDGASRDGLIETADEEILDNFDHKILKSSMGKSKSCSYRIVNLTTNLHKLDLIKNKHIPDIYLCSSFEQRLALFQGLMDTDGSCDKTGRVEFTSVIPILAQNVYRLALSLGIKAHIIENKSFLNGKRYKNRFRISFITRLSVFRLKRKLSKLKINNKAIFMSTHRYIVDAYKINSKPMKCLTVNSKSNLFLITRNFIPTHNTGDVMFFDEVQEMPAAAISNSAKVLTKAQYGMLGEGVQVFFGTPLQRGSEFWKLWQQSSQQFYYLGCEDCKKHFPLYTPGSNEWESIWIYGNVVKCTHCGCEQDRLQAINRGKWVATKDPAEATFVGFHLNQLYLPEFTKEQIMDKKPGNSAINTERSYQNEILGEFFQGEAAIITPEEIRAKCGDPERKFRGAIAPGEEVVTFLGIDIGAKADMEQLVNSDKVKGQGQSYSTAVVLSLTGPGRLSIEYAFKFKRNDLASKKSVLDETIKRYKCKLAVCDIGYAHDFNEIMQTEYGDKFLASQASGRVTEKVKYSSDIFPKVITFERDFWVMELYEQMRKGMVRFPLGSYEQIAWLIQHCSNMEIKPSLSRIGEVTPHYVKSGVNDGFMALLNAYIAYKFYISQGFQVRNPLLQNDTGMKKPQASVMAVYSPR